MMMMNKEYIKRYIQGHGNASMQAVLEMIDQLPDVSEQDLKLLEDIKAATPDGFEVDELVASYANGDIRVSTKRIHKEPELFWHVGLGGEPESADSSIWIPSLRVACANDTRADVKSTVLHYDLILCDHVEEDRQALIAGHWNDGPLNQEEEVDR